jgi:O-acetylhomoserine (thiol)-lyase
VPESQNSGFFIVMKKNLGTLCVQGGWTPKNSEPRVLPIYQSTTFKYSSTEEMAELFDLKKDGYFYTRLANPTNDTVAAKINALEGGVGCVLTSSGQAANFYAVFNICEAGGHIVASNEIYGGTYNLFGVTMKKLGIECTFIDQSWDDARIEAAFKPNTKCFFGETISNPGGNVFDIERFAKMAHKHGVPLIVDNTFATPVHCRPFEWGCDIVTHSTTKYMDGHATTVGGAVIDSGNFDWDAHSDKFPGLCTPDASYHGLDLYEIFW